MDTKTIIKIIPASRTKEYYITQRKDIVLMILDILMYIILLPQQLLKI